MRINGIVRRGDFFWCEHVSHHDPSVEIEFEDELWKAQMAGRSGVYVNARHGQVEGRQVRVGGGSMAVVQRGERSFEQRGRVW